MAAVVVGGLLAAHAIALAVADAFDIPAWAGYAVFAIAAGVSGYLLLKRQPPREDIDLVPEAAIEDVKRDVKLVAHAIKT